MAGSWWQRLDRADQLGTPLAAAQAEFAPDLRKDHQ